jgi:uncharacterized protein YndB with AHSA1/START domain
MQDKTEKEQDRIELSVEIAAPVSRVWRAIADYREFGEWFRVELDGPFEVGQIIRGNITYPGYEHLEFAAITKTIVLEELFAFAWCPGSADRDVDPRTEPQTLVEFKLEASATGTKLIICESGFSALPKERREAAFPQNLEGWKDQITSISGYLES